MSMFQAARRYLKAGLAVIPLWPDKRKNPHLSSVSEYTTRLPTIEEWARWANQWPAANLGLITGYWQNLVCLDFDDQAGFDVWANGPGYGVLGQTWQVKTGRGYHMWFKVQDDPGSSRLYHCQGHEVLLRARGGYCIVPPSVHWSGKPYTTVHKVPPLEIDTISHYLAGWEVKIKARPITRARPVTTSALRIESLIPIPERAKPNGRGAYQVYCPFHEDSTPSAWLNVGQQHFGCNACWPGLWWDTANVYAKLQGLDNGQAYREVMGTGQALVGVKPVPNVGTVK
jgi:hypothetical protein